MLVIYKSKNNNVNKIGTNKRDLSFRIPEGNQFFWKRRLRILHMYSVTRPNSLQTRLLLGRSADIFTSNLQRVTKSRKCSQFQTSESNSYSMVHDISQNYMLHQKGE